MTIEYQNIRGNRKHKDELFCMVFSKKEDLLDLYNAVNGTDYKDTDALEVNTLENVLYMTMKNDISFMIGCTMNLYEHQSSYNPNMPLRGLLYFAKLYSKYTEQRKLNLYSSTLQKIPAPQFIVFYNGMQEESDRQILKLSNAFETEGGCLECKAVMLNINFGRNKELMEKCRRLEEYVIFIATVRKYALEEHLELGEAISCAIDECIMKEILSDILIKQRAEVFAVVLETFDKELYERDLEKNITERVTRKVRAEIAAEMREEVRAEVEKEIEAEVRAEVEKEIEAEVRAEVEKEIEAEVRAKVEKEIEAEVRAKVEKRVEEQIRKKLHKGKTVEQIADELEEGIETVQKLIEAM